MAKSLITVYLDSSDYSTLSNPRQRTDRIDQLRITLMAMAQSNHVRFVFSGAHLSEMAPLDAKYALAATARADLLVDLCGRNALISFDRLIASEVAYLMMDDAPPVQAVSTDATWFPEFSEIFSPVQWADVAREIDQTVRERGLNRNQRQALKRQLFKANQPQPRMRDWLANQDPTPNLSKILRVFPMRPQDAKVISRYVLGQATPKEAEDSFLESLRDPRWMMRWFATHHDKLTPVIEWLRGPSRDMATRMREMATQARDLRSYETILGPRFKADMLTITGWRRAQDEVLLNVANRLLTHFYPDAIHCERAEIVDIRCPGLSTAIRSLHSSLWTSFGSDPRPPKESDFVDAVHAMYAPYVTLFRSDRYMAPHIRKQVVDRGTLVVSRLDELPDKIHGLLHCSS